MPLQSIKDHNNSGVTVGDVVTLTASTKTVQQQHQQQQQSPVDDDDTVDDDNGDSSSGDSSSGDSISGVPYYSLYSCSSPHTDLVWSDIVGDPTIVATTVLSFLSSDNGLLNNNNLSLMGWRKQDKLIKRK